MSTGEQFEQATTEAMALNLKAIIEAWQSDSQQQAKQRQGLQDELNAQHLRFVEDQHTLVMRTADANAASLSLALSNAATLAHLIGAGEIDTTAQGAIGAKVAGEVRDAAKVAIDEAIASVAQTSAAAQGTTGVAQGGLQMQLPAELAQIILNNNTIQTALLAELAKISQALAVILVKVTGEATETA